MQMGGHVRINAGALLATVRDCAPDRNFVDSTDRTVEDFPRKIAGLKGANKGAMFEFGIDVNINILRSNVG